MKKKPIKKAQDGSKVNPDKYVAESKKRVAKTVAPLRKEELKKGINTYDDYLKSKIKPKAQSGASIKKKK